MFLEEGHGLTRWMGFLAMNTSAALSVATHFPTHPPTHPLQLQFSRPVYVGKPVTAVVEVTRRREREESSPPSTILFCSTHIIDEQGVCATAGEAVVMLMGSKNGKEEKKK